MKPRSSNSNQMVEFMKFPVVLHKDPGSDYGVTVPDVPGCFSAGETVSEALDNLTEALALHFEGLMADGEPIPQPQEVDVHLANPDYAGGVWAVVEFDTTPYLGASVRFNATMPEHLLRRIDERVKSDRRYASRSGFLATAALRELQHPH
ncbi:putative RNase H-like HicB family nuclease [Metapseudomonas resinovorans]